MNYYDSLTPEERYERVVELLAQGVIELSRQKAALKAESERWNRLAPKWREWDAFLSKWFKPVGEAMIAAAAPKAGQRILDLGCGTGDLGLEIAARVPGAEVVGVDSADGMVRIAQEKAIARGLTNYKAMVAEASDLPFDAKTFDAILARHAIMFFEMRGTMKDVGEVLKPRGTLVLSSWGPEDRNPWLATIQETVRAVTDRPLWIKDHPGPFRYADPQALRQQMREADVWNKQTFSEIAGEVAFRSPDHYWQFLAEVEGTLTATLAAQTADRQEAIKRAVLAGVKGNVRDGGPVFGWTALVASGVKPKRRETPPMRVEVRFVDEQGNEVEPPRRAPEASNAPTGRPTSEPSR